jgi:hypothetical protein
VLKLPGIPLPLPLPKTVVPDAILEPLMGGLFPRVLLAPVVVTVGGGATGVDAPVEEGAGTVGVVVGPGGLTIMGGLFAVVVVISLGGGVVGSALSVCDVFVVVVGMSIMVVLLSPMGGRVMGGMSGVVVGSSVVVVSSVVCGGSFPGVLGNVTIVDVGAVVSGVVVGVVGGMGF